MQSEDTVIKGETQQKTREHFLSQANASYEKADQAVKLSARILEEAQQTLNTLKGKRVQSERVVLLLFFFFFKRFVRHVLKF